MWFIFFIGQKQLRSYRLTVCWAGRHVRICLWDDIGDRIFLLNSRTAFAMAGKRRSNGGSKEPSKAPRLSAKQLEEQPYIPEVVAWFLGPTAVHVLSSKVEQSNSQSIANSDNTEWVNCFKPAVERDVKTSVWPYLVGRMVRRKRWLDDSTTLSKNIIFVFFGAMLHPCVIGRISEAQFLKGFCCLLSDSQARFPAGFLKIFCWWLNLNISCCTRKIYVSTFNLLAKQSLGN